MRTDFSKVLFTDETRVTLDGPDGWSKGWVAQGCVSSSREIKAPTSGFIIIWAGITEGTMGGPWRDTERSENDCCNLHILRF